ncbi:mediator of RNA polymerase II transcription subunit 15 isoform X2 [Helicoverpa armigera]|uniref:mediator of RNA polymerase II transcription subunit 15 isoform X2 n=1 Tax=Helicoverpa armigera TaxID=29058 RepID=UPI002111ED49|nr:mediator of RNA polymerase II transcription subunit 15 isoform X2 [Helicoverpa armigera]
MPAVTSTTVEEQNEADQKMWSALKRYIIRERQRKKEEYEAEVEEERLRKEREARERQDVMTLEETKEQIEQLEQKLKQLEKEKQQLFMQLKKVLNEDEIRKRQQQKETNEMQSMKMQTMGGNIQIPMFPMPTSTGQGEPPPTQGRPPPLTSHMMTKHKHSNHMLFPQQPTIVRGPIQSGVKRPRSPSPTYALYAHRLHQPPMKHQQVYSDHKVEDGRMGRQMARAVLWNKPSQYGSNVGGSSVSSTAYYAMPSSGVVGVVGERPPPLLYAHHAHTPHTPHTPHHANLMYAPAPQPPQLYLDMLKNRDGQQHQEQKKEAQPQVLIGLSEAHHPSVSSGVAYAQPPVSRHLSIHPPPQHNNMQNKIERSGFPTRKIYGQTGQYYPRIPSAAVEQRAEQHISEPASLLASNNPSAGRQAAALAAAARPCPRPPRVHHMKHILLRALMHELLKK